MTQEMVRYYAHRAGEYERVYTTPPWQADLARLRVALAAAFAERRVLDVACGTGYWTLPLAEVARHVHGVDINAETLAIAAARAAAARHVTFARADAYAPAVRPQAFDGGLAALWLSHVDRARLGDFVAGFHACLGPGAVVVMFDERPHAGRTVPTSRVDADGNRYEPRRLAGGERYEIVKNFYAEDELAALVAGERFAYRALENFWLVEYRTRAA